ncbi:MAG: stress-induced protein [Myxococcales bacterium]|nr:stress-induced protein [Myxococcales bacterium]
MKKPLPRGFAVLDAERRREIARLGGQTAHKNGNAHRFNPQEASQAGKKGGATVSENRDYMADIGRRGGLAKRGYKQRRAAEQSEAVM